MGQMHFHVPEAAADFFHRSRWSDAYLCGIEGVPWQTRNLFRPAGDSSVLPREVGSDEKLAGPGTFTLNRSVDTSAKLFITCPVDQIGFRVLTTCSLRCLETPHLLMVELARGSCHRVRMQSDTWQRGGLVLSDEFEDLLRLGTDAFLDSIQPPNSEDQVDQESTRSAKIAITLLEQAASVLGDLFSTQSISFRRSREPRLSTMMAVGISPPLPFEPSSSASSQTTLQESAGVSTSVAATKPSRGALDVSGLADDFDVSDQVPGFEDPGISQAFNAAAVRISWGDIENDSGKNEFGSVQRVLDACGQSGMRVIGGPIIDHRDGLVPDWLTLLGNDFEKLMSAMTQFVEATVNEFRGRVHLWNAVSGLNVAGPLSLDDEQVMRFTIGVLQTIRRCDPNTPVIVSIDQPCGEYLAKNANGISPIHFADALLRSGLGLAGIGLNFRFGYSKGETQPRSSVDFAQWIDRWATLNTPLLVQLSVPAAPGEDASAKAKLHPFALIPELDGKASAWADTQHAFAKPLVQTLLAKQIVHAVVWDGWSDEHPHLMPHAGVIDAMGNPRPLFNYFAELRDEVVM